MNKKVPSFISREIQDGTLYVFRDFYSINIAAGRMFSLRQIRPAIRNDGSDLPETKSLTRVVLNPSSITSCF